MPDLAIAGYEIAPDSLPDDEIEVLCSALGSAVAPDRGGARDLLRVPAVQRVARHPSIRAAAERALGPACFAVRGLLFDKTANANWRVVWHQDVTIAVKAKHAVPGYGPWSEKAGIPHVQPPAAILDGMLAIRVHLDPCGLQNGPLRVLPGSHGHGKLSPVEIDRWRERQAPAVCTMPRGGLLLMRPLLLHSSSTAETAGNRRVLHLEFAVAELAAPLDWYDRCGSESLGTT